MASTTWALPWPTGTYAVDTCLTVELTHVWMPECVWMSEGVWMPDVH